MNKFLLPQLDIKRIFHNVSISFAKFFQTRFVFISQREAADSWTMFFVDSLFLGLTHSSKFREDILFAFLSAD